ncbi:uncharacterized protein LOC26535049 [Drosophila yakuba]|uniref:Uncharacterized protein n=1 Tax=Drosophila yakuba TaxID=7245 RepID=A0A0R1DLK9_DROYA|nr:uncharacterized protein LOC26535049 [Drosophila yakuba]KRJ98229.1 uncharacterized protein Dyak_GE27868 [Drosophila yakuba]
MSKILSFVALSIYFPLTFYLPSELLPCLEHSITHYSWDKCEQIVFETILIFSGLVGVSGLLWVSANFAEYHFLFNWIIFTFEIIVLEVCYMAYAIILSKTHIWIWRLVFFGFLVVSFILVSLHLLVAKKIVKTHLIEKIFRVVPGNTE